MQAIATKDKMGLDFIEIKFESTSLIKRNNKGQAEAEAKEGFGRKSVIF